MNADRLFMLVDTCANIDEVKIAVEDVQNWIQESTQQ